VKANSLTNKEKGNMILQNLVNIKLAPLSPLPMKSNSKSEIFIRPLHDEYGNEIALVVHGSGTYTCKEKLISFGVAGTYFDKEKIVDLLKRYGIHDFEKDGRFFHSKGSKGGFWIFTSYQNTILETVVVNKGKFENLLENFEIFFKTDVQSWILKIAPPMVIPKENTAMWGIYAEISRRIEVSNLDKQLKKNILITTTVVDDNENY